jgi:hypothetical protein
VFFALECWEILSAFGGELFPGRYSENFLFLSIYDKISSVNIGRKKTVEKIELEMQSEVESVIEIKKENKIMSDHLENIEQNLGKK